MNQLVECLSADSTLKAPGGLEIQEKRNKYKDGKENKDFGKVRKDKKTKKLEKQVGQPTVKTGYPEFDNLITKERARKKAANQLWELFCNGTSRGFLPGKCTC